MRALLRLVLVCVILLAAFVFLRGWWSGGTFPFDHSTVGTSGHIDTQRARDAGAKLGEQTAVAAQRAENALSDAGLTAKIKSKMALDDTVRARVIDVSTSHGVVTLQGTVGSAGEHDRAVQLARETNGVTRVVDHLTVQR